MNKKLFVSGAVLALLAMSMNASAYHIEGTGGTLAGNDPHTYNSATSIPEPVDEPCTNSLTGGLIAAIILLVVTTLPYPLGGTTPNGILTDLLGNGCLFDPAFGPPGILFALTLCEQNDEGFGFPGTISKEGNGGLCSMSPGYDGVPCVFANVLSNGFGPNYDNVVGDSNEAPDGPDADTFFATIAPTGTDCEDVNNDSGVEAPGEDTFGMIAGGIGAADYYTFDLTGSGSASYQVNGITCSSSDDVGIVDMKYAYLTDGGHLTGFENVAGATGTYTVAVTAGATVTAMTAAATAADFDCATGTPAPIFHCGPAAIAAALLVSC